MSWGKLIFAIVLSWTPVIAVIWWFIHQHRKLRAQRRANAEHLAKVHELAVLARTHRPRVHL